MKVIIIKNRIIKLFLILLISAIIILSISITYFYQHGDASYSVAIVLNQDDYSTLIIPLPIDSQGRTPNELMKKIEYKCITCKKINNIHGVGLMITTNQSIHFEITYEKFWTINEHLKFSQKDTQNSTLGNYWIFYNTTSNSSIQVSIFLVTNHHASMWGNKIETHINPGWEKVHASQFHSTA